MDFSNLQPRLPAAAAAYFPLHRTQLHPRMHSSAAPPSLKPQTYLHKLAFLLASLLTVPFLFYLFSTARKVHHSSKFAARPNPQFFGVVIDSRPGVSRVRVYRILGEGDVPVGQMPLVSGSMKVRRGLGDGDSEGAGGVIRELVEFAKERVPKREWENTKIQLMAGGGVLDGLGLRVRERILESCRRVLRESGFAFKDEWARVMQDEEKGVYSWVAVNYALQTLGSEPQKTTGIVELGATSLQVTFALKEVAQVQSLRLIKLAGATYNLHTQSLQKFGQDAAWELLQEMHNSRELLSSSSYRKGFGGNPCTPKGYEFAPNVSDGKLLLSHPVGNFTACKLAVLDLLKSIEEKCLHPPCKIVSSFFLELQGKSVSKENLFYASELFGLFPRASLIELETAGRRYCEDDWDKLQAEHPDVDAIDLSRYCFSSAYTVALLHDGLGVGMNDKSIGFVDHTGGGLLTDWTLGAFILQSMLEPLETETANRDQIVGYESVTYFSLFAFLLVALLAAFFVLKWRKPQLKTIYDLEKGRYIVTRVPR